MANKKNDYNAIEKDENTFQKYLKSFVIATLRRSTFRWPFKNIAKTRQRIERGFYTCEECKQSFGNKDIELDHKNPVIDVKNGWTNWDDFINRLFVKSHEFQVLCEGCHSIKTSIENVQRVSNGQKAIKRRKKKK
jgi:5-methylcytosine-specific restriction endonuclease McrA